MPGWLFSSNDCQTKTHLGQDTPVGLIASTPPLPDLPSMDRCVFVHQDYCHVFSSPSLSTALPDAASPATMAGLPAAPLPTSPIVSGLPTAPAPVAAPVPAPALAPASAPAPVLDPVVLAGMPTPDPAVLAGLPAAPPGCSNRQIILSLIWQLFRLVQFASCTSQHHLHLFLDLLDFEHDGAYTFSF